MPIERNVHWGRWNPPTGVDPEYDNKWGDRKPPITAFGNIQYLDFIDMVKLLWEDGHPGIYLVASGNTATSHAENGYITYSKIRRVPKDNNTKPRSVYEGPDELGNDIAVLSQSFINDIKFTAIHREPRVAEEMLEEFEIFMMEITPLLKMKGIEELLYGQGLADEDNERAGLDLSGRSVLYRVITQMVFVIRPTILERYSIKLDIMNSGSGSRIVIDDMGQWEENPVGSGLYTIPGGWIEDPPGSNLWRPI